MATSKSERARVVAITGVTRGLGRAMADEFASLGWRVFGCGQLPSALDSLRRNHPEHRFTSVDVVQQCQVDAWANSVIATAGPPDLLLNNAAVINRNCPVVDLEVEEFFRVIDVNVKGVFLVTRAFLPAMIARKTGVIVNFSSGWGRSASAEVSAYCASKFAIEGFTQALARELPAGMAAVPLNPGVIDTDMLRSCFGEQACNYPSPQKWVRDAMPFLLQLGAKDNGRSLTVPSAAE